MDNNDKDNRKVGVLTDPLLKLEEGDLLLTFSIFDPLTKNSFACEVGGKHAAKVLMDAKIDGDLRGGDKLNNWPCLYKGRDEFIELVIV